MEALTPHLEHDGQRIRRVDRADIRECRLAGGDDAVGRVAQAIIAGFTSAEVSGVPS